MADIFISYATVDRPVVRRLADALGARGWSVWWDYRNLRGGQHFHHIIEREISTARVVIVVWSKNSAESRWVRDEATLALEENKLVPLRIDMVRPPLGFRSIHTIDLSSWTEETESEPFERLVEDLGHHLDPVNSPLSMHPKPPASTGAAAAVQAAYDHGDYATASSLTRPVAERGDQIVLFILDVLLNWSTFAPLLMLLALSPNVFARFADHMGGRTDDASILILYALLFWGLGMLLVGEYFACSFLPSHKMGKEEASSPTLMWAKGKAHVYVIVFGCLWAATLTFFAAALSEDAGELTAQHLLFSVLNYEILGYRPIRWVTEFLTAYVLNDPQQRHFIAVLIGIAAWCMSLTAFVLAAIDARKDDLKAFLPRNILYWALSSLSGSLLLTWGFFLLWGLDARWHIDVAVSLGPLWVIFAYVFQVAVYVGLRDRRLNDDDAREWIAQISAVCLTVMVAWAVIASTSLLLPRFLWDEQSPGVQTTIALTGAGASLLAAFGGSSGLLSIGKAASRSGRMVKAIIVVARGIAISSLLGLFSRLQVNYAINLYDLAKFHAPAYWEVENVRWQDWLIFPLSGFAVLLIPIVLLSFRNMDLNQFSLPGFFRNASPKSFSVQLTKAPPPIHSDTGDN